MIIQVTAAQSHSEEYSHRIDADQSVSLLLQIQQSHRGENLPIRKKKRSAFIDLFVLHKKRLSNRSTNPFEELRIAVKSQLQELYSNIFTRPIRAFFDEKNPN